MGYYGKLDLKRQAQELRTQGYSYNAILQKIPVSKDSISRWCRDIVLNETQKNRLLQNKAFGQKKGSMVAAENKKVKREQQIITIHKLAKKEIGELSTRDEFISGIALYAAEGTKMDKHGGFTNADPQQIKFMANWFMKYAKVPKAKLRGRIWLHKGLDEQKAKEFWSKLSTIPIDKFTKTYITKNKVNSNKIRKNIHEFGIFTISFSDAPIHRKIMGWISAMFDARIATYSAVAQR